MMKSYNLLQENGALLMIKPMVSMEKDMKMTQLLNLIQKLLNQISVTI